MSSIKLTTLSTTTTTREVCVDFNYLCSYWANFRQCNENPFWMRPHCQKSCNSCGEKVEDVHAPIQKPGKYFRIKIYLNYTSLILN